MSLVPGTRLGPYEVLGLLGEGGMGQVYRARDSKLNRDVALKILPASVASDPERLARFQREAQVLASLNHPNIGHIYGFEDSSSTRALVLELVPGPTLADRIARGAMPWADAAPIAIQIAEALETAHGQGIIHRDLKPANVKVRDDGTVKVLDFGLAKAMDPTGGASAELMNSPTITSPAMTQRGIILGTAAYMSPEQARGKPVDKRADIWAFGCVLYEMLTGTQTFGGETLTDVLASVVRHEPDMRAVPADTPRLVRSILRRCLQKDPAKRLHDIADAKIELQEAMAEPEEAPVVAALAPPPRGSATLKWVFAAAALVIGLGAGALAFWVLRPPDPKPVIRLAVTRPDGSAMGSSSANTDVTISPDGEYVAYTTATVTGAQLHIRNIHSLDTITVAGVNATSPFISPDSKWVGFFDQSSLALKKVSVTGGAPMTICSFVGPPRGGSWGSDDRIVFATADASSGLMRVPAGGGTAEMLTKPDPSKSEQDHWFPDVLPGGGAVLFTVIPPQGTSSATIARLDVASGKWETLLQGSYPRFVAPGHLVFGVESTLRAVAFDAGSGKITSDPVPVVERVMRKTSAAMNVGISETGTLAYLSGDPAVSLRTLTWVDRGGHEEPIPGPTRTYVYPRLSPDGTRLALDIRDQENDVWVWDFLRRTLSRLTIDPGQNRGVAWTPDGKRIAFSATRDGKENVYWQSADGSGVAERLTSDPGVQVPSAFTPDGKFVIFQEPGAAPFDLGIVDVTVPADQRRSSKLLGAPYNEGNGEVSPDGRWIAYESNESGQRNEIYVRPFPDVNSGGRWQVSTNGGTRVVWLPKSGRELFYLEPPAGDAPSAPYRIMAVPVRPGPTFAFSNPEVAVEKTPPPPGLQGRHYDVAADGKRFLVLKPIESDRKPPQLIVVLNWGEELKRLVPATK